MTLFFCVLKAKIHRLKRICTMPQTKKPLRKKVVKVRFNDDEYETLMTKKTRQQLAVFIREKALLSADNVKVISVDHALVRAVGKIGNNQTHQHTRRDTRTDSESNRINEN